jgi:hypothetical protein
MAESLWPTSSKSTVASFPEKDKILMLWTNQIAIVFSPLDYQIINRPTRRSQLPVDEIKDSSPPGWSSKNGVTSYTYNGTHVNYDRSMDGHKSRKSLQFYI